MNEKIEFIKNNVWVYEREGGDYGLVIAESKEAALEELRRVYPDVDDRISDNSTYFMYVFPIDNCLINGNVIITHPY